MSEQDTDAVNRISDIIHELKRLQIEHGDIPVTSGETTSAWPEYNEEENRIEF